MERKYLNAKEVCEYLRIGIGTLHVYTHKGKFLYQITPKDVEEFKALRVGEVKPATVNRELATLKTMLGKAVEWGKLDKNPVKGIKFFKEDNRRLEFLEKEEIKRFLEACPEKFKPIAIVAIHTGMRRNEILNLKWYDIDFKRNILYLLETKNGEKREVYLSDTVRKTFIAIPKHTKSPYVFSRDNGERVKDIRKPFIATLKESGIKKELTFHSLRHTYGSQLAMAGIDLKTIQELMGHKDLRMTERYAHLSADHKRHAVEVFDSRMDTYKTPSIKVKEIKKSLNLQPFEIKAVR